VDASFDCWVRGSGPSVDRDVEGSGRSHLNSRIEHVTDAITPSCGDRFVFDAEQFARRAWVAIMLGACESCKPFSQGGGRVHSSAGQEMMGDEGRKARAAISSPSPGPPRTPREPPWWGVHNLHGSLAVSSTRGGFRALIPRFVYFVFVCHLW